MTLEVVEPVIDRVAEVSVGTFSVLFFFGIYYAARPIVNSVPSLRQLSPLQKHELLNVIVSLVNSSIESVLCVALLWAYNVDQTIYANYVRLWVMFFLGYNVYDTLSCCFHNFHIFRLVPQLIPHHILIVGAFIAVLFVRSDLMFYYVAGGVCEIQSVNLHIRNILRVIKPHLAWLRWPNELMNAVSFVMWRFSSSVWLVYQGWIQQEDRGFLWVFLPSILLSINCMMGYHLARGYVKEYRRWRAAKVGTDKQQQARKEQ